MVNSDKIFARIGPSVKEDLLNRGINTKEAARLLGVSPAGVSVYFSGRRFSAKTAKKWAEKLGLDEDFLISGKGHPSGYVSMAVTPEEKKFILSIRDGSVKLVGSKFKPNQFIVARPKERLGMSNARRSKRSFATINIEENPMN